MFRAFYQGLTFNWLPVATMLFFALVFGVVLLRVFFLRGKTDFDALASLPFDEEKKQ